MEFSGNVDNGPRNRLLHFGHVSNHGWTWCSPIALLYIFYNNADVEIKVSMQASIFIAIYEGTFLTYSGNGM